MAKKKSAKTVSADGDGGGGDGDSGSGSGSKRKQQSNPPSSSGSITKRVLFVSLVAVPCLSIFVPRLLHKMGFHEEGAEPSDPLTDFLETTVLPSLERGWAQVNGSISSAYISPEEKRPGFHLAKKGAKAKYPVFFIPGFVTSGLEVWGGETCARKHFRQRLWGSVGMAEMVFQDRECWLRHLALDPYTGKDPKNVKVRAAQGYEAADYFIANYWVWGKLIENLADVGYDNTNMHMMSYDWRLAYPLLEERDGFLTKVKYSIEAAVKISGRKVVIISHSMGGALSLYFLKWVSEDESNGGGGGGKDWVERHVHSYVNIGGALLGAPKALTAILSGEMRDTAEIMGPVGEIIETYLGRRQRKRLFSTWGALWSLLPKGGDSVWNVGADFCNSEEAITHLKCSGADASDPDEIITFTDDKDQEMPKEFSDRVIKEFDASPSRTLDEAIKFLLDWGAGYGPSISAGKYYAYVGGSGEKNWHDPTATPLPDAPSLKIYCLYGVGINTERSYYYMRGDANTPPFVINTTVQDEGKNLKTGIRYVDGDESLPLISLGYMCANGWIQNKEHNPSSLEVITREFKHEPIFEIDDPTRTGPHSARHVDMMGNVDMLEDILKIATDFETASVSERIISDIKGISQRIDNHRLGGIKGRTTSASSS